MMVRAVPNFVQPLTIWRFEMTALSAPSASRSVNIAAWVIQLLLSAAFLAASCAKLAGAPMMLDVFHQIGLGQGFRYLTAIVEIVGVVALLTPGSAVLGALWLGFTMFVAILTHLLVLHSNPGGAVVLFGLCAVLVWLRRGQAAALRERFS
jgi:uncharacterized membrane protein YphA (DoxX/SURF4 family)